jgi:hypothetical protein
LQHYPQDRYHIISVDDFFTLGLKHSAYFPAPDGRNLVRQFFNLLQDTHTSVQLTTAIAQFQFRYQEQFNLIKRICWQHLDQKRKQSIHSLFSSV